MKKSSPEKIRVVFHGAVPDEFLVATGKCLLRAYREAFAYARENFPGEEAHDLYPQLRREMFERNWRIVAARRKDVLAEVVHNQAKNCFHTRITRGRVVLTASAVEAPNSLVRDAIFRKTLAESSQHHLFGGDRIPPEDALLYGIILHGPTGVGLVPSPSFIRIAFPSNELDEYIANIDLLVHLPELAAEIQSAVSPTKAIRVRPRLRRVARRVMEND